MLLAVGLTNEQRLANIYRREVEEFKAEKYSKCSQHVVDFDVSEA